MKPFPFELRDLVRIADEQMEKKRFYFSLILSLLVHLALISYLSSQQTKIFRKPLKQIEVTYHSLKPMEVEENPRRYKDLEIIKETKPAEEVKILPQEASIFSSFERSIKDISKFMGKLRLEKKQIPKIKTKDMSRKITVPLLKSEKITNPQYLNYNQTIRQKIKQRAYSYVDHPDFQEGEVYLTFVVLSSGVLKQIKIIEEKTTANTYLRTIGLRSVKEANPFLPFPKDLNYPELTFNIIISFEVKD